MIDQEFHTPKSEFANIKAKKFKKHIYKQIKLSKLTSEVAKAVTTVAVTTITVTGIGEVFLDNVKETSNTKKQVREKEYEEKAEKKKEEQRELVAPVFNDCSAKYDLETNTLTITCDYIENDGTDFVGKVNILGNDYGLMMNNGHGEYIYPEKIEPGDYLAKITIDYNYNKQSLNYSKDVSFSIESRVAPTIENVKASYNFEKDNIKFTATLTPNDATIISSIVRLEVNGEDKEYTAKINEKNKLSKTIDNNFKNGDYSGYIVIKYSFDGINELEMKVPFELTIKKYELPSFSMELGYIESYVADFGYRVIFGFEGTYDKKDAKSFKLSKCTVNGHKVDEFNGIFYDDGKLELMGDVSPMLGYYPGDKLELVFTISYKLGGVTKTKTIKKKVEVPNE